MADINDILAIKPTSTTVEILHPGNGKKIGLTVEMVSLDDDRVKSVTRRVTDNRLKKAARGKNFTSEEIEENEINIIAAACVGWEWGNDEDGVPGGFDKKQPEFSNAAVRALLRTTWVREQLNTALGETERFFQN